MNTLEHELVDELHRQADGLPPRSGDLERVQRVGGRWLLAARVASVAGVAVMAVAFVAATAVLRGGGTDPDGLATGGRTVFEDGYALTPQETTTLLVDCLQGRGLDVVQVGDAINYDNRVVSELDFETGLAECETGLRGAGFLLPGDNPENLRVLYAQFKALAECYRDAGIQVSDAPGLDEFVDARQTGTPAWSPQTEAIRQVGVDDATRAERVCGIPTPEEIISGK
jgi:hypothetical protein